MNLMDVERRRHDASGANSVSAAVFNYALVEVVASPAFQEAVSPPTRSGIDDRIRGVTEGVDLAASRIIQIQQLLNHPEAEESITSVTVGSKRWAEMLGAWEPESDPHGLALLERGIILDREEKLILAKRATTKSQRRKLETLAAKMTAGQRLIINFYRGLVEHQVN